MYQPGYLDISRHQTCKCCFCPTAVWHTSDAPVPLSCCGCSPSSQGLFHALPSVVSSQRFGLKDNLDLLGLTIDSLTELVHCSSGSKRAGGKKAAAAASAGGERRYSLYSGEATLYIVTMRYMIGSLGNNARTSHVDILLAAIQYCDKYGIQSLVTDACCCVAQFAQP